MDGLVNTVAACLSVRDTAQRGAGEDTESANYAAGLVGEHVAEGIVRVDDTVEHSRAL